MKPFDAILLPGELWMSLWVLSGVVALPTPVSARQLPSAGVPTARWDKKEIYSSWRNFFYHPKILKIRVYTVYALFLLRPELSIQTQHLMAHPRAKVFYISLFLRIKQTKYHVLISEKSKANFPAGWKQVWVYSHIKVREGGGRKVRHTEEGKTDITSSNYRLTNYYMSNTFQLHLSQVVTIVNSQYRMNERSVGNIIDV